jgi:hypothetical protein
VLALALSSPLLAALTSVDGGCFPADLRQSRGSPARGGRASVGCALSGWTASAAPGRNRWHGSQDPGVISVASDQRCSRIGQRWLLGAVAGSRGAVGAAVCGHARAVRATTERETRIRVVAGFESPRSPGAASGPPESSLRSPTDKKRPSNGRCGQPGVQPSTCGQAAWWATRPCGQPRLQSSTCGQPSAKRRNCRPLAVAWFEGASGHAAHASVGKAAVQRGLGPGNDIAAGKTTPPGRGLFAGGEARGSPRGGVSSRGGDPPWRWRPPPSARSVRLRSRP